MRLKKICKDLLFWSRVVDTSEKPTDSEIESLLDAQERAQYAIDVANPQYYVSECPDTGRQFLVETSKDGNIVELTPDNIEKIRAIQNE